MDTDEKLISLVKNYPSIYNNGSESYKDNEAKNNAWLEISRTLYKKEDQKSVAILKKKWKNLRDTYVRTIRAENENRCGLGKRKKPWRYSNDMQFLFPYVGGQYLLEEAGQLRVPDLNGTQGQLTLSIEAARSETSTSEDSSSGTSSSGESVQKASTDTPPQPPASQPRKRKATSSVDKVISFITECRRQRQLTAGTSNEVDMFFTGISAQVKTLRPVNQILLQRQIANLVLDYKLKEEQEKDDFKLTGPF